MIPRAAPPGADAIATIVSSTGYTTTALTNWKKERQGAIANLGEGKRYVLQFDRNLTELFAHPFKQTLGQHDTFVFANLAAFVFNSDISVISGG